MINEAVKEDLNDKIQDGEFDVDDIPAYLTLFCEMGNEIEDLQEEVEGWNRRINLVMEGLGTHWLTIEEGRFATGAGAIDSPNVILTLDAMEAAMIFAGDKDAKASYMSGALKVEGDLPDAVKVQTLIEIVIEEIEF
jgi:hypothetical protein